MFTGMINDMFFTNQSAITIGYFATYNNNNNITSGLHLPGSCLREMYVTCLFTCKSSLFGTNRISLILFHNITILFLAFEVSASLLL